MKPGWWVKWETYAAKVSNLKECPDCPRGNRGLTCKKHEFIYVDYLKGQFKGKGLFKKGQVVLKDQRLQVLPRQQIQLLD